MPEAWPIGVPSLPDLDAWAINEHARAPDETEMERGNVRARRRATLAVGVLPYQIIMSLAEYTTFKTWLRDMVADGTAEFTMNVFDGTGCPERVCRIRGGANAVSAKRHGPKMAVAFQLDVRGL